jgi:hypothetical protein
VTRPDTGLRRVLHVSSPAGEHAGKLMLFGRFVGSWHLDWTGAGVGGQAARMSGELHFGWVLGGRAVQDIWIIPGRVRRFIGRPFGDDIVLLSDEDDPQLRWRFTDIPADS